MVCCLAQFIVLFGAFFSSLLKGAEKEEKIIFERKTTLLNMGMAGRDVELAQIRSECTHVDRKTNDVSVDNPMAKAQRQRSGTELAFLERQQSASEWGASNRSLDYFMTGTKNEEGLLSPQMKRQRNKALREDQAAREAAEAERLRAEVRAAERALGVEEWDDDGGDDDGCGFSKAVIGTNDTRQSSTEPVVDGTNDDGNWTFHVDEATGYRYRYNCVTGETAWCIVEEYDESDQGWGTAVAEEGGTGRMVSHSSSAIAQQEDRVQVQKEEEDEEDEDDDVFPAGGDLDLDDDGDDIAGMKARLRRVLRSGSQDGDAYLDGPLGKLIHDKRGDWVEVCDEDGVLLGDQLKGSTVYYNRVTFETRFTKPPGWVRLQASALSRVSARVESSFRPQSPKSNPHVLRRGSGSSHGGSPQPASGKNRL